jgi:hypothetical protein
MCFNVPITGILVLASLFAFSGSALSQDDEFSITVDTTVPAEDYVQWELVVTKGQMVEIQLSSASTALDFYFMEPADYSEFIDFLEGTSSEPFGFVPELSSQDSLHMNKSADIAISSVYYFVVVNDGTSDVRVSGFIRTVYSEDSLLLAIFLVLLIIGVVVIAFLIYAAVTKREQPVHPAPSSRVAEGRTPVPAPKTPYHPDASKRRLGTFCASCGRSIPEGEGKCPYCGTAHVHQES